MEVVGGGVEWGVEFDGRVSGLLCFIYVLRMDLL